MINQTLIQIKQKISEIDFKLKKDVKNKDKYKVELAKIKTKITELYKILDR